MPKEKKKSKKEKKKELEEKRRQEEELLRQQQEEERRRQEELAQKKREEELERQKLLQKKRQEELVRLDKERSQDIVIIAKRESDLAKLENDKKENGNWKKHLACDSMPDASIEQQLNDFLSMWTSISLQTNSRCSMNVAQLYNDEDAASNPNQEFEKQCKVLFNNNVTANEMLDQFEYFDTISHRNVNHENILNELPAIIQDIDFGYQLMPQLNEMMFHCLETEDYNSFFYAKNRLKLIGRISSAKLHELTTFLLRHEYFTSVASTLSSDNNIDGSNIGDGAETTVVTTKDANESDLSAKKEYAEEYISYGLWSSSLANAFKNIKIDFPTLHITIELPKQVPMKAGMPLALNVIQLQHDLDMRIGANEHGSNNNNIEKTIYHPIGPILVIYLYQLPQPESLLNDWHIQPINAAYKNPLIWEYATEIIPDSTNPETITVSYHIPNDVAVDIANSHTNINRNSNATIDNNSSNKENQTEKEEKTKSEASPTNELQLGWWNAKSKCWDTSDFKDIKSEFVNSNQDELEHCRRRITFTTCHIATPIALVQPVAIDFRHKDWKLQPAGVERCRMELIGQRYNVVFEIVGSDVQLLEPNLPQISKIKNKYMTPSQLINALNECGINLCPQLMNTQTDLNEKISDNNNKQETTNTDKEDVQPLRQQSTEQANNADQTVTSNDNAQEPKPNDAAMDNKQDNQTPKHELSDDSSKQEKDRNKPQISYNCVKTLSIQSKAHIEVSTIAPMFEIGKSKWNRDCETNENTIIFKARKPLSPNEQADMKEEHQWMTIMINQEKCTIIDCSETDSKLNLETPINELSHTTLFRCLEKHCNGDATFIDNDSASSFRFQVTLRRLLNLLNLFAN